MRMYEIDSARLDLFIRAKKAKQDKKIKKLIKKAKRKQKIIDFLKMRWL